MATINDFGFMGVEPDTMQGSRADRKAKVKKRMREFLRRSLSAGMLQGDEAEFMGRAKRTPAQKKKMRKIARSIFTAPLSPIPFFSVFKAAAKKAKARKAKRRASASGGLVSTSVQSNRGEDLPAYEAAPMSTIPQNEQAIPETETDTGEPSPEENQMQNLPPDTDTENEGEQMDGDFMGFDFQKNIIPIALGGAVLFYLLTKKKKRR
jgi:hypothetical protein